MPQAPIPAQKEGSVSPSSWELGLQIATVHLGPNPRLSRDIGRTRVLTPNPPAEPLPPNSTPVAFTPSSQQKWEAEPQSAATHPTALRRRVRSRPISTVHRNFQSEPRDHRCPPISPSDRGPIKKFKTIRGR